MSRPSTPRDPFLVPGGVLGPACRSIQAQGRRASTRADCIKRSQGAARSSAGRQGRAGHPAGEHRRTLRPLRLALRPAEARSKEQVEKSKVTAGAVAGASATTAVTLAESEWESLRKAIFDEGGPLAIGDDAMRFILDQGQRPARAIKRRHSAVKRDRPPAHPRGRWSSLTRPSQSTRTYSCAAIPVGRARQFPASSSRFFPAAIARRSERKRPARAGPGDRLGGQPAVPPACSSTGSGSGTSARDWSTPPATSASAATRPLIPSCSTTLPGDFIETGWSIKALHRQIMLSSTYRAAKQPPARLPETRSPRTGCSGGSTASGSISRSMRDSFSPSRARSGPSGGPSRARSNHPIHDPPHGLRLHRPPEPRRRLPDF